MIPVTRISRLLLSFVALAATAGFFPIAHAAENDLRPIFDGRTLDGWKVLGCEAEIVDGAILVKEGNGIVQTDREYGNFVLEFDWKALREEGRTDSGVYFRYKTIPAGRPWPDQYQVNLLNDQEGAIPGRPETITKGLIKPGEWNRFRLSVFGTKATLEINGNYAWTVDGIGEPGGYIGLQAEVPGGGRFLFKNVKLAELKGALVPNPDFIQSDGQKPLGWFLVGGEGEWKDGGVLALKGDGKSSNHWASPLLNLAPWTLYRYAFEGRYQNGKGCVPVGPGFLHRDFTLSGDWEWRNFVFVTPSGEGWQGQARLSQWEAEGGIEFGAVRVCRTRPVYKRVGNLLLGSGESIQDGEYRFECPLGGEGSNFARPLAGFNCGFNSYRWCFGEGSEVVYRFKIPGFPMRGGSLGFTIGHHVRGTCIAEVSRDGENWVAVAELSELANKDAPIPAELFPADSLLLRLRAKEGAASLQVTEIRFRAQLEGTPPGGTGDTMFADIEGAAGDLEFRSLSLAGDVEKRLCVELADGESPGLRAAFEAEVTLPDGTIVKADSEAIDSKEKNTWRTEFALPLSSPGEHRVVLSLASPYDSEAVTRATLSYDVPDFYRADYGAIIEGVGSDNTAVWWCDAVRKIPRTRALPVKTEAAATLCAAKNDREAVQIVVRPKENLKNLAATASAFIGPDGAAIGPEQVKILWAYYHFVHHPSDETGARDFWPDALPPLEGPIDVAAGMNQPLWVLVSVPTDAKAGDYTGTVSIKADGFAAEVPVKLHLWNFALPEKKTLQTAFGLSPGTINDYHQLKTDEDKRRVFEMYLQSFAEHRVSPYDPVPYDNYHVTFNAKADPPRAEIDFAAFDREMQRVMDAYHFNSLRLDTPGMGGGTFHERWAPKIGDFTEETPEYQAMFSSFVKQLQDHLAEKGWLDMAYTYWFDEPDPKDYEFVSSGMMRIKKYAPNLRNMLTEQPNTELKGVDIWCPLTPHFGNAEDAEAIAACRQRGDTFWWYICCGPKAPYCTLFIDHPATEFRVWHWQAWEHDIKGTLIWTSNYWTSSAAYPDEPQNPYEDPMGYVSGYSTPKGVKLYWGNGDGRFVYPPLEAAVPGKSGPDPVIKPPVSSIRWEMIREGVEDYEYLAMLRRLLEEKRGSLSSEEVERIESLLAVPEEISKSLTEFTTDPASIFARRKAIAEAIEQLSRE